MCGSVPFVRRLCLQFYNTTLLLDLFPCSKLKSALSKHDIFKVRSQRATAAVARKVSSHHLLYL